MALPKVAIPKFSVTLPSTGEKVSFRPFLVKEEKVLLIAMQSDEQSQIVDAIKDVVIACVDENIDASKLPYFDIEYLFLNIRAKSIGEDVAVEYRHNDGVNLKGEPCDAATQININIEQVKVEKLDGHTDKIKISDDMVVEMKYPTIDAVNAMFSEDDEIQMLASCIKCVYEGENVHDPDNLQDSIDFIEGLNNEQFGKMMEFLGTMPKLRHKISYKCSGCGQEDTIFLEGLSDFF